MSDKATIFIPDITGYTEFLSATEVVHSSHIINELLEVIVDSNASELTVAEIEGDAVLFFKKGEPIDCSRLIAQCRSMFENFHLRLKLIERDALCECGACRGAANLSLKFIVHYGPVSEMRVASFSKPAGIEVIVAHRLLKNGIGTGEYILVTGPFFDAIDRLGGTGTGLMWNSGSDEYPAIGKVDYRYADLSGLRTRLPALPERKEVPLPSDADPAATIELTINAPLERVFDNLSNPELLTEWVSGLRRIEEESGIPKLGKKHLCIFDDYTLDLRTLEFDYTAERRVIIQVGAMDPPGLRFNNFWVLTGSGRDSTRLMYTARLATGDKFPPELSAQFIPGYTADLEKFRRICERPA